MGGLAGLGLRNFRRHAGRHLLTAAGIAFGVAALFGVLITNDSANRAIARTFSEGEYPSLYVRAVGAAEAVPRDVFDRVAKLPGVHDVYGSAGINLPLPAGKTSPAFDRMRVYATDTKKGPAYKAERQPSDRLYTWVGKEPREGTNDASLDRDLADLLGLRVGSSFEVAGPHSVEKLQVSIIYTRVKPNPDSPGNGIRTQAPIVERMSGRSGHEYVQFRLRKGEDVDAWLATHGDVLGPGYELENTNRFGTSMRDLADRVGSGFTAAAAVALFVAALLIYLTLSTMVVERFRTYGTLRALGASRAQVGRVVITEALALGVVGTAAGLALGALIGRGLLAIAAQTYGITAPKVVIGAVPAAVTVALGVVVTLGAALIPAVRAARAQPAEAIRATSAERGRLSRGWIVGLVLFAGGLLVWLYGPRRNINPGPVITLLGAVLLVPPLMGPVARLMGRVTGRVARGVGEVGVLHLVKQRSRSAYTLALVMVVLGMVFTIESVNRSYRRTIDDAFEANARLDIVVNGRLDADTQAAVARVPGVLRTTPVQNSSVTLRGRTVEETGMVIVDPSSVFGVYGFVWARGSSDQIAKRLLHEDGVIVPEGMAARLGVRVRERVALVTPRGAKAFTVAGLIVTADGRAPVTIGLPAARRYFDAGEVADGLGVTVKAGADVGRVAAAIKAARPVFAEPLRDEQQRIEGQFRRAYGLFLSLVLLATIIGMLGLANTLTMSVLMRTREIGILRAVGTDRWLVRRMVLAEASTLVAVGAVLAIPLAWVMSLTILNTTNRGRFGIVVHYVYPWPVVPRLFAVAVVFAVLASVAPARRASNIDPVRALRFD